MWRLLLLVVVGLLACPALAVEEPAVTLPPPATRPIDFAKEVKPLFEASCVQCHAKGKDKGGLSLETRDALLKGGDDGAAVVTGDSGASSLIKLVSTHDADTAMPKKGTKWTADQIGVVRAWIDQGMVWDPQITFAKPESLNLKPRNVSLPGGDSSHPVDRLLGAYFSARHITPPAVVEDRVFCRRAYLDVIGLLPTPKQLHLFLSDTRVDKRDGLVRMLLDDRRGYADQWLTFWNDLLRNDYRGTGFIDGGRRQITGWLFASLVENKPYDKFVSELVNPNESSDGFSRGIIWRGSVNASMLPPVQAAQNISQVFLGVNLKCASCHDSFVSNWTLADAYGLAAVYSDDTLELIHCDKPTGKMASPRFLYPQLGAIDPAATRPQRLATLAGLMTAPDDGRLSRTIVNRLWAKLLGRGLVEPLDDMERPAWNSDLLDWLSEDLVAHHYDLKHTIEVILTSKAYQMPALDLPAADGKQEYVFQGPLLRRMTAEQFSDAVTSLTDQWARFPATLDVDFRAGNLIGDLKTPAWVWTDEPVETGTERAHEEAKNVPPAKEKKTDHSEDGQKPDASAADSKETAKDSEKTTDPGHADTLATDKDKEKEEALDALFRHRVGFRRRFKLDKVPTEAFAAVAASQGFFVFVNGKLAKAVMADSGRNNRVLLFDLKPLLVRGENAVVIDVASHTEKKLNDIERAQFPASRNHLNKVSGMGFYLRAKYGNGEFDELISDNSWSVRRAPEGKWRDLKFDDSEWATATPLPPGELPVDEGPGLPPITRRDFANEPINLDQPLHAAASTAVQPGGIRASLLVADPLMSALDRPNREQVITVRSNAATTLQALELTNGNTFDTHLKQAAARLVPLVAKDPSVWVEQTYLHLLGREPSDTEAKVALEMLGNPARADGICDLLWGLTLLPEFQFIN